MFLLAICVNFVFWSDLVVAGRGKSTRQSPDIDPDGQRKNSCPWSQQDFDQTTWKLMLMHHFDYSRDDMAKYCK